MKCKKCKHYVSDYTTSTDYIITLCKYYHEPTGPCLYFKEVENGTIKKRSKINGN